MVAWVCMIQELYFGLHIMGHHGSTWDILGQFVALLDNNVNVPFWVVPPPLKFSSSYSLVVVKKYQEEVKQLQQELEQRQKMGRARDVIISNLEQEKSQMQKKRETE